MLVRLRRRTFANMMWLLTNVLLCGYAAAAAQQVELQGDRPFLKVLPHQPATLECCYSFPTKLEATWFVTAQTNQGIRVLNSTDLITDVRNKNKIWCHSFVFKSVQPSDSALYQCWLKDAQVFSHGTYLHVSKLLDKTFNLTEKTKNRILKLEGILLLLCVVLPTAITLLQRKRLNELEKKKVTKDTENIYQGLNLDECCPKYDEIQRSPYRGPYQDVCSASEEEVYQLEKP